MEKRNTKLILGIVLGASAIIGTAYLLGGGGSGVGNEIRASDGGGIRGARRNTSGGRDVGNGIIAEGGGIAEGGREGNG